MFIENDKHFQGQSLYAVCEPNHEKTGPDYITCIDGGFGDEVNTCEREKIDCDIPTIAHGILLFVTIQTIS